MCLLTFTNTCSLSFFFQPPGVDNIPPPLPVKQRRATGHIRPPINSPTHTPAQHTTKYSGAHVTADSMPRSTDTPGRKQSAGELPPVPMRMESIPWVKNALVENPPPKPPRTDRPLNEQVRNNILQLCYLYMCTSSLVVHF